MAKESAHPASREAALAIVRKLRAHGHQAYLAGGCVRDELRGSPPQDYDVATSAPPATIRKLFPRTQAVGEAFGVILVRQSLAAGAGEEKGEITTEVATFRTETGYSDGRRPDQVEFTDARTDAQRRDFTINGLFGEPQPGDEPLAPGQILATTFAPPLAIIDYVGGVADLRDRILRAIGDPQARFAEDYLRMLRAVRFAARLDFTLEANTAAAIAQQAGNLARISRERIGQELRWMLAHPHFPAAIELIERLGLDGPALQDGAATPGRSLATVAALAGGTPPEFATILVGWMLDRHGLAPIAAQGADPLAENLESWLRSRAEQLGQALRQALVLTNEEDQDFTLQLQALAIALRWPGLTLAQKKRLLASRGWAGAWRLLQALGSAYHQFLTFVRTLTAEVDVLSQTELAPEPLVRGDDLIALGCKPSPVFRRILDKAYDCQLEGRFRHREDALAWLKQQPWD